MPEFSVIVPVYNSEATLAELFTRIKNCFDGIGASFEVIFVDDGSSDHSWQLVTQLKNDFSQNIKAVRLIRNFGQHNAIFCGLHYATGNFFITVDDDLQHAPEDIPKLIQKYEETKSELIYGCYERKSYHLFRNAGTRMIQNATKSHYHTQGDGSSFRMFTKHLGKRILEHTLDFVYIDELLMWYTGDISYVSVQHKKRKSGKSGYTRIKLLRLTWNLIMYYTAIPLKLMVYVGLLISGLSFLLGIYYIIRKILFDVPHGYTSIIVAILFSTGLIVFSLGIIGGYLVRIYRAQHKKPAYAVKSELL
ncbi:MAG: glycosyltransferase family 2 protein [Bacteroidales bacterium]|nr:glycosyltransferase family 2 protein [Bacteroidales bacterium]